MFFVLFLLACLSDRIVEDIPELPGAWHGDLNFKYFGIEAETTAGIQLYFLNEYSVRGWAYHGGGFINYGKQSVDECTGIPMEGNLYLNENNVYHTDCMKLSETPTLCVEIYFYGEEVNANIKFLNIDLVSFTLDGYRDLEDVFPAGVGYNDGNQFYCIY
jgi:hypothetical protein